MIAAKNGDAVVIAAVSMADGHWRLGTVETFKHSSSRG
jgi:hypothetical protein